MSPLVYHSFTERIYLDPQSGESISTEEWMRSVEARLSNSGEEIALAYARGFNEGTRQAEERFATDYGYPCARCAYAGTCGDPPGDDCHS